MSVAIKLENISKQYRLGQVGTGTISHDLNRWWHRVRGKEDPYSQVGQENRRDQAAESEYVWALKDINLEVEQGEVLGIIGANGAGKSTLLKLISRITSPTTGAIKAKGRIASLLEVGTGMHPEMTARENIYLNGSLLGMRRHEITKKFDDIVDFAGCRMYVDTPVKRYSSGMRVRLAFAVAAFLEPEILIVDEVLAVGDAEFQKRAIGKMKEVSQGGGRTVLFVSHNMDSIVQLCPRSALLRNGTIENVGDSEATITAYIDATFDITNESHSYDSTTGIIRSIRLRSNGYNTPTGFVRLGDDATVEISYTHFEPLSRPTFGVVLMATNGTRVSFLQTAFQKGPIEHLPRSGTVSCTISSLPLVPGAYSLTIGCSSNNIQLDHIHKALSFTVTNTDYYATGYLPKEDGIVHLDAHWSFRTSP